MPVVVVREVCKPPPHILLDPEPTPLLLERVERWVILAAEWEETEAIRPSDRLRRMEAEEVAVTLKFNQPLTGKRAGVAVEDRTPPRWGVAAPALKAEAVALHLVAERVEAAAEQVATEEVEHPDRPERVVSASRGLMAQVSIWVVAALAVPAALLLELL